MLKNVTKTKRLVLSVISSWYNPLGLLSPITIKYKIQPKTRDRRSEPSRFLMLCCLVTAVLEGLVAACQDLHS